MTKRLSRAASLGVMLLFLAKATSAQATRIVMDGLFQDWRTVAPAATDPVGDAPAGQVDLGRLWLTHDEAYFFLRVELGAETLIQEANQVVLYLDTDNDADTGVAFAGLGADLVWRFGDRTGTWNSVAEIGHAPVGIVTAPTVSSTEFEVAFPRNAQPDGANPLFPVQSFRLALEDRAGGDRLPDASGGVNFAFSETAPSDPLEPITLAKEMSADVRILSYNIQRDGVFGGIHRDPFLRQIRAIQPEIIGFQEILSHSATETRGLVEEAIPAGTWHAARVSPDLVLVSRYPILQSYSIPGGNGGDANAAFLLDMQDTWGTDLLLINGHPPCCRNDEARQIDIDEMMAFVREAREPGGTLTIQTGTPIIILGDMNLVGAEQQLTTLVEGDIVNTSLAGPSFAPDWDGTALTDLMPRHVGLPMTFTWYNEDSAFHPGRLDFVVYTDAVLEAGNRFVLFTPGMTADALTEAGLEADDSKLASDHLPVVGDFRYTGLSETDVALEAPSESLILDIYPNPVSAGATLTYRLRRASPIRLVVFDVLGREVDVLVDGFAVAGDNRVAWSTRDLPPGIYVVAIETPTQHTSRLVARAR